MPKMNAEMPASAELDAGLLLEVHVALQKFTAVGLRPDLYQPMADAIWNLYDWLRALAEGTSLISKGYECSERVWAGLEVSCRAHPNIVVISEM